MTTIFENRSFLFSFSTQSGEHSLEMYRLRTDEELDKILKKKQKRARKRREK